MKSLLRRLSSIGLLWQILLPMLFCVSIGIAVVQLWTVRHTRSLLEERLTASLNANIAMLQADLDRLGNGLHRDGDRLLIGNTTLNDRNDIVDRVATIAGGVATIFAGDSRVATTIRKDDGSRAVGTALAPGPARTAALDRGETFRGVATILGKDYLAIYQPLKNAAGNVVGLLFVGLPTAATEAALAASQRQTRYVSLLVLAILGVTVGLVLRGTLSPLVAMTGTMRQLAAGDLAVEIPGMHRQDQVGRMAAALEVFKRQAVDNARLARAQEEQRTQAAADKRAALVAMADMIDTEATTALTEVDRRTAAMAETANGMTASATRTGASAQRAATASAQALANAQTVASAAEQLTASIHEIGEQVSRSTAVVARAVAAGRVTRETIEALNQQVGQIGAVADMIGEIAAKTNLLALNATIEAARAGDAGKGFAVVASEVKQLATQTAKSTAEISRHIAEVRAATGASVDAVGRIEHTIGEIDAIAGSIAAAVEQQGAATAEIARNVTETAAAANTMTTQTNEVSLEAGRTGERATEVLQNTTALDAAVHALRHNVIQVVRSSTSEVDRRGHRRLPCLVEATIGQGGRSEAALLHDISEHGCYAVTKLRCDAGGHVDVGLSRFGKRLRGTVVEHTEDGVHFAFTEGNLPTAEAERISLATIADLVELTKADHLAFVKRVADAVETRANLPPEKLANPHECRLGRWRDHVSDPPTLALAAFRALDEPHFQVHEFGRSALVALAAQDMAAAQRHVAEMRQYSQRVLRCLDEFGRDYPATVGAAVAA